MPHVEVPKRLRASARTMRRKMTDAELKFWNAVRAHRLENLGFRRQLPIDAYIVDFACPEHRLIVEIDGSQHAERRAKYDTARTAKLEAQGWTVLRFWNDDILRDLDAICTHILRVLHLEGAKE